MKHLIAVLVVLFVCVSPAWADDLPTVIAGGMLGFFRRYGWLR